ncbi:hypothetical protein [Frankia sp. Cas3]|uniref:hypothetical protein n=1 Tax=Frankia sp. Cas3 TaxID=3073926 RepID=UPI002AD29E88|nr:hypothetical protein [Frankia sp. Cas3]
MTLVIDSGLVVSAKLATLDPRLTKATGPRCTFATPQADPGLPSATGITQTILYE